MYIFCFPDSQLNGVIGDLYGAGDGNYQFNASLVGNLQQLIINSEDHAVPFCYEDPYTTSDTHCTGWSRGNE